jgi:hypothetical protein
MATLGYSLDTTLLGGGFQNVISAAKSALAGDPIPALDGTYFSNPANVANIENGYRAGKEANPYAITRDVQVYDTATGYTINEKVVVGYTGYAGYNTGENTPSEINARQTGGPGSPNSLGSLNSNSQPAPESRGGILDDDEDTGAVPRSYVERSVTLPRAPIMTMFGVTPYAKPITTGIWAPRAPDPTPDPTPLNAPAAPAAASYTSVESLMGALMQGNPDALRAAEAAVGHSLAYAAQWAADPGVMNFFGVREMMDAAQRTVEAGGNSGTSGNASSGSSSSTDGGSWGGGTQAGGGAWGENDSYRPVILDLDGDGLSIVQRDASTMTFDMAGDGLQHRTAWVGKGDGVLAIDADGDGRIDQRREIIFTDWDPGAGSDMKALRSVFDTNHNGRLDAGDARFGEFRVVVDGQVKTLAELGIVSIDLVTDGAPRRYADGSAIEGRSTFTRADGSTGTAADASFVSDADGWRMDKTSVAGADGRRVDTLTARAVDGTLVSQIVSVTSADGSETTTSFDDDGDGLVDRRQVTSDTTAAGGRVTAVRFYDRQGALRGSITTARYNAGALEIVELDRDGDGKAEQGQRYEALADGSSATTITMLNPDGTIRSVQRTTVSADGLDRVVTEAPVGQTVVTSTRTLTTYAADGTRTDTATVTNADGTLRAGSVTVTSADGRTNTVSADRDGSGLADLVQASVLTTDPDGRIRSVVTTRSQDATLIGRTTTVSSANGLSTETFLDESGADRTSTRILATRATNAAGATTRASEVFNADGSRRSWQSETVSLDQRTLTRVVDADGDAVAETSLAMTTAADGRRTTVTREINADQSLRGQTTRVTDADGLNWTETSDVDGDGAIDRDVRFTTNFNADHSLIERTRVLALDGTELSHQDSWTSADRNTTTLARFVGASAVQASAVTTQRSLAADGTLTETVTVRRGTNILAGEPGGPRDAGERMFRRRRRRCLIPPRAGSIEARRRRGAGDRPGRRRRHGPRGPAAGLAGADRAVGNGGGDGRRCGVMGGAAGRSSLGRTAEYWENSISKSRIHGCPHPASQLGDACCRMSVC